MKSFPISKKFKEVEFLRNEEETLEKEFQKKIIELKRELYKNSKLKEVCNKRSLLLKEADLETRKMHSEFLEKAYRGDFGRGKVFLVYEGDGKYTIRRLLWIGDEKETIFPHLYMGESEWLNEVYWRQKPLDLNSHYDLNEVNNKFVEVGVEGTTLEEYKELFKKNKYGIFGMEGVFDSIPKEAREFTVGELVPYGRCSHHSGDIEGYLIVLPSGRFAVVSSYSGEKKYLRRYALWGVTVKPPLPGWSARGGCWEGGDLFPPTKEEIDFLKTGEYKVDLEEYKAICSSSGEQMEKFPS